MLDFIFLLLLMEHTKLLYGRNVSITTMQSKDHHLNTLLPSEPSCNMTRQSAENEVT